MKKPTWAASRQFKRSMWFGIVDNMIRVRVPRKRSVSQSVNKKIVDELELFWNISTHLTMEKRTEEIIQHMLMLLNKHL